MRTYIIICSMTIVIFTAHSLTHSSMILKMMMMMIYKVESFEALVINFLFYSLPIYFSSEAFLLEEAINLR